MDFLYLLSGVETDWKVILLHTVKVTVGLEVVSHIQTSKHLELISLIDRFFIPLFWPPLIF